MAEHIQPLLATDQAAHQPAQPDSQVAAIDGHHHSPSSPKPPPEPADWLPQRHSNHLLVVLPQFFCLLLLAMIRVASMLAPTCFFILIASHMDLGPSLALIGPVMVGCNWALAALAIVLRWLLVRACSCNGSNKPAAKLSSSGS
jgi:hypothetical protein